MSSTSLCASTRGQQTKVKSTEADEAGTAEADATTWATPVVPSTKVPEGASILCSSAYRSVTFEWYFLS